jgi:hypothetical protein
MPESALTAPKEKKLTGRLWYESGKAVCYPQLVLPLIKWIYNSISHVKI